MPRTRFALITPRPLTPAEIARKREARRKALYAADRATLHRTTR